MKSLKEFINDLSLRESGGNYKSINKFGYIGKYQMGEAALIDCGYYKKDSKIYNSDWSGKFLGKDGVNSLNDFLNNPQDQDKAEIEFLKCQWRYLKALGIKSFIGEIINNFKITQSSTLAGAHLKGASSVLKYLKSNGKTCLKDGFGTSIEEYMKKFTDYDVSQICD